MWNFLVWIFESGLLVGFAMLVIYSIMFGIEFYPMFKEWVLNHHVLHSFQKVYIPLYKQTSIIIAPTMCEYHKKCARLFLFFSYLNALIIFSLLSIGCVAYWNLVLLLLFFILAAAHNKVQGRYEQVIWEAACNTSQEKSYEKLHIKKKM